LAKVPTYKVKPRDTLWKIAADNLGSGTKYIQLAAINNIENPNLIPVGMEIKLEADESTKSATKTANSNKITKITFGEQSNADNTLFATWTWDKDNTASYKVQWTYNTGDGVWFSGSESTNTVDKDAPELARQSTYSIPSNAKEVRFKVKPISETKKENDKEVNYWDAVWSDTKTWTDSTPLATPSGAPDVTIKKYTLTATLNGIEINGATQIEFQVIKNNKTTFATKKATIETGHASYAFTVDAGGEYKVRCRALGANNADSEWTAYSSNVKSIPSTPASFATIRANDETSVYLDWKAVNAADTYDIEYTDKKEYFGASSNTTTVSVPEDTLAWYVTGLESGKEYFFRLRAKNEAGESSWSEIKSVVIGTEPAAPTTWSSTTTAIVGEIVNLYWVHNSEDGSSQKYAEVELTVDDTVISPAITVKNLTDKEEKDKTRSCSVDTSTGYIKWTEDDGEHSQFLGVTFVTGSTLLWRVRTAGITNAYSDWSIQRTIEVNAKPTLDISVLDSANTEDGTIGPGEATSVITSFPFYIYGLPGPATQAPIGYHLSITSNDTYETTDNIGNAKTVNAGESVYSKYFDVSNSELLVEMSANNVDLQNGVKYTVKCTVAMNSGLTAEDTVEFSVSWEDQLYEPNASLGIDFDTMTASIRPYCTDSKLVCHTVTLESGLYVIGEEFTGAIEGSPVRECHEVTYRAGVYTKSATVIPVSMYGSPVSGAKTKTGEQVYLGTRIDNGSEQYYCYVTPNPEPITETGEQVYLGMDANGTEMYYCFVEEINPVTDVWLAVYRREFDCSFIEIASGLDGAKSTTVTDPHPALDYARYRIVATDKNTGAVSYFDPPGYPISGKAAIIQWDEEWSSYEVINEDALVEPAYSGSMLVLPYNLDVSDDNSPDVSLVKYVGREHPVSYYGTHVGSSSSWKMDVPSTDKETLYALRRLARWMGDVYVREPSGSGYWANVTVSFSQTHRELTIPVTLKITRVEGGV
jgi:hypothetical protein